MGSRLAEAARLEAASVEAFVILERELADHGAPVEFARDCRRAAREEVGHARAMAALARRFGAEPLAAELGARPATRTLVEIARENAAEGCARETYGALVAAWQGRHAADPVLRRTMAAIAEDELRHAELAWQVAAWLTPQLTPAEREQAADSREAALEELVRSPAAHSHELQLIAGWPRPEVGAHFVQLLQEDLRG